MGLIALGAALATGFFEVLERRFAEGGLYPHYASYRSDPLGVSAFYESLERLDRFAVSRNLTHLDRVEGLDGETALLLLGYPRDGIDQFRLAGDSAVLEAVKDGARLVITINPELVPEQYRPVTSEEEEDWFERRRRLREEHRRDDGETEASPGKDGEDSGEDAKNSGEDAENSGEEPSDDEGADEPTEGEKSFEQTMNAVLGVPITEKFGFELADVEDFQRPEAGWEPEPGKTLDPDGVPKALPLWYSQYRFETSDAAWRPVATVADEPVVIERKYGHGSVVVASDSFFVSNEALHLGAEPAFLLWMLGGKERVVFDETIHGTRETGGAMKLIRRYRLHGIILGILLCAALWAWRSAAPLAPGSEELDRGLVGSDGAVAGEEIGSGLIRLLRRSLERGELLDQCVAVWRDSRSRALPEAKEKEVDRILARHRQEPGDYGAVRAYDDIVEILRRR